MTRVPSLTELERRLAGEPQNLDLRMQVALRMCEEGRSNEALEHYRQVATVHRDQGRPQQAIAVCRGILTLSPYDKSCHALLRTLLASGPALATETDEMWTSNEVTPLPLPLPYHVVDPTGTKLTAAPPRADDDLADNAVVIDDDVELDEIIELTHRELARSKRPREQPSGLAEAARQISEMFIEARDYGEGSPDYETRPRPRAEQQPQQRSEESEPTLPRNRPGSGDDR